MAASLDAYEVRSFATAVAWERWLDQNPALAGGIWLRFFKKASGRKTVSHPEALDAALCHGWIDGQVKPFDADSWLHKFTPRRPRSLWSKRNQAATERLIKAGRMKPAGAKQIELAKADGRWAQAYDSPSKMEVPADFLKALARDKKAKIFFESLNRANVYAIAWRLQTAKKPETRARRMAAIQAMLAAGRKFHD
jgi:uncharacterized protein YdeI (YjbR/CyaY-like superfamily)